MTTYLTVDKDGQQASLDQEEIYKYKAGFERKEDGSYVKLLGDERCITDKREKARIIKELEDKKNKKVSVIAAPRRFTMTNGETYTLEEIRKMFKNPSNVMITKPGVVQAYSVQLPIDLPCDHPTWIGKIEADKNNGEIRYWFHQTWKKEPDVLIADVIVKQHEQPTQEQNTETDQQLVGA